MGEEGSGAPALSCGPFPTFKVHARLRDGGAASGSDEDLKEMRDDE
jgi:hypothetical protein